MPIAAQLAASSQERTIPSTNPRQGGAWGTPGKCSPRTRLARRREQCTASSVRRAALWSTSLHFQKDKQRGKAMGLFFI